MFHIRFRNKKKAQRVVETQLFKILPTSQETQDKLAY